MIAEKLALGHRDGTERLTTALSGAKLDLNPHQVEAAAFALDSLRRAGCLLADEVGLGKTIEAGLAISQLATEGKTKALVICPANLRMQWQRELADKFELEVDIVDGSSSFESVNPFDRAGPVVCSFQFAASRAEWIARINWDVAVIDEAHHLRNAHRDSHKTARALKAALRNCPKILLTATPLQNSVLEIFGLTSFLDERLLGPEEAFRSRYEAGAGQGAIRELRDRVCEIAFRTLRRQVREYVRFTNRRSLVEDFAWSEEERQLYQLVSDYLRRPDTAGIPAARRSLLTLVYRKLLASSSYAIAPTLRQLAERLKKQQPTREFKLGDLQSEVSELERYAQLAEEIKVNAKGEALGHALDRIFTVARAHQWPEKAVVFTESRRTQEYLFRLLGERGYRGRVSLLSGNSGTASQRNAVVDTFREKTQILLSTEAGAEGLNLQFCNLVVNFDLPWNPQRIEQRIGRCHRYGQPRDVLVINFLNRRNAADARLLEILQQKLHLFDGVFGASDEILGALGEGVDFEKRVLEIYQSCRSPEEINAAFDALRADLENLIAQRMKETQSLLFDRFDGEVRRRLRLVDGAARSSLARYREEAEALVRSVLGGQWFGRPAIQRAIQSVRAKHSAELSYLRIDPAYLSGALVALAGSDGWWLAYRVETSGLAPDAKLIHLVLIRQGDQFRQLSQSEAAQLLELPASEEKHRRPIGVSLSEAHEMALNAIRERVLSSAESASAAELDRSREQLDRYTEDCLADARQAVSRLQVEWEAARKSLLELDDSGDRDLQRTRAIQKEREYRQKLAVLRREEESRYSMKDQLIAELSQKAKVSQSYTLIAAAYFWI